jgi:hypothetical protein
MLWRAFGYLTIIGTACMGGVVVYAAALLSYAR